MYIHTYIHTYIYIYIKQCSATLVENNHRSDELTTSHIATETELLDKQQCRIQSPL